MTLDRWKLLFPTCSILIDHYTWREGEKDTLNYWDAALELVLMYHVLLTVLQNQYWRVTYLVLCLFFFNWFVSFSFNSTLSAEKIYIYYVLIVFLLLYWQGKDGLISPCVGTALERLHQVSTESRDCAVLLLIGKFNKAILLLQVTSWCRFKCRQGGLWQYLMPISLYDLVFQVHYTYENANNGLTQNASCKRIFPILTFV